MPPEQELDQFAALAAGRAAAGTTHHGKTTHAADECRRIGVWVVALTTEPPVPSRFIISAAPCTSMNGARKLSAYSLSISSTWCHDTQPLGVRSCPGSEGIAWRGARGGAAHGCGLRADPVAARRDSGGVDQAVELAKCFIDLGDDVLDVVDNGEVGLDVERLGTLRLDGRRHRRAERLLRAQVARAGSANKAAALPRKGAALERRAERRAHLAAAHNHALGAFVGARQRDGLAAALCRALRSAVASALGVPS